MYEVVDKISEGGGPRELQVVAGRLGRRYSRLASSGP